MYAHFVFADFAVLAENKKHTLSLWYIRPDVIPQYYVREINSMMQF